MSALLQNDRIFASLQNVATGGEAVLFDHFIG